MVFSIMGSLTEGYFFAFHLFDIVTVNQLLKGVIRAVTLNGESIFVLFTIINSNIEHVAD